MRELNNVKVIGTDHGFGNMKVASACFRSGVTLCEKEPAFKENLLVYDGRYYLIGESHKEFTPDKMRDEDYYLLTLAAIGEELHANGLTSALVHIAAGLPLTWVSEQKDRFRAYLTQNYNVSFTFRGIEYHVTITGASVFPQGFAAVADKLRDFRNANLLCDIGNGTMNMMFICGGCRCQRIPRTAGAAGGGPVPGNAGKRGRLPPACAGNHPERNGGIGGWQSGRAVPVASIQPGQRQRQPDRR